MRPGGCNMQTTSARPCRRQLCTRPPDRRPRRRRQHGGRKSVAPQTARARRNAAIAEEMSSVECSAEAHNRKLGAGAGGAPVRAPKEASALHAPGEQTWTRTPSVPRFKSSAAANSFRSPSAASAPVQRKCCTKDSGLLRSSRGTPPDEASFRASACKRSALTRKDLRRSAPPTSRSAIVASAAAQDAGGAAAEKQYPEPERRWWSMRPLRPAQKPPTPATECSKEPMMASILRGSIPCTSRRPRPLSPKTPKDKVSSRMSRAPYFSFNATSSASGAKRPVRWQRDSATMKVFCLRVSFFPLESAAPVLLRAASTAATSP
mmetsp:Transcript_66177/g.190195  ORF Transcript_66177/g.190195 Transcript_66177/m.190195 type:complete len:320 (+) Transcript_66177:71-1030(+)